MPQPSRTSSSFVASIAVVVVAAALALPVPAHAQLRGLMNKAKEKAAEKVAEKTVDKAAEKAGIGGNEGGGRGAGGWATPAFGGNVVEITPGRVDQLLRGMAAERAWFAERERQRLAAVGAEAEAERAYEVKRVAYERQQLAYQMRMQRYTTCMMNSASMASTVGTQAMVARMAAMSEAEQERFVARMEDLTRRGEAAEKRGDKRTMAAISDTIQRLTGLTAADGEAARQANANRTDCGPVPPELTDPSKMPVPPVPPSSRSTGSTSFRAGMDGAGASAAGLPVPQYAMLRERVGALVIRYAQAGTKWGFTDGERNAVATRRGEFNQFEDLFTSDAIAWGAVGEDAG